MRITTHSGKSLISFEAPATREPRGVSLFSFPTTPSAVVVTAPSPRLPSGPALVCENCRSDYGLLSGPRAAEGTCALCRTDGAVRRVPTLGYLSGLEGAVGRAA